MKQMPKNHTDIAGMSFGRVTAIKSLGLDQSKRMMWLCRCSCGNEKAIQIYSLLGGITRSCGCGVGLKQVELKTSHGGSRTKLYKLWYGMKQRCQNPNANKYDRYGGRGITVCKEWESFPTFRSWAFANGYRQGLTIDRVNNNGNYGPGNCRWATRVEQRLNRKDTWILPDGRAACKVAAENGIGLHTFGGRMKAGWPLHQACTWPVGLKRPHS